MKIKITSYSSWLHIVGLRLFAIIIEIFAVWLGDKISSSFSGNCGDNHPSIAPAIIPVLIGLVIAFQGTINIYKAKRYIVAVVSSLLSVVSIVIGLVALFIAAFQLCF